MSLSLTSFFMAIFFGSVMIILLYFLCNIDAWFYTTHYRFFLTFTFLIILRILLPFETKYSITIPSTKILPPICDFFYHEVFMIKATPICVYHLVLLIWLVGSLIFIFKLLKNYLVFIKILYHFPQSNCMENVLHKLVISDMIDSNIAARLRVVRTELVNTPCVTGIRTPIILLPDMDFAERDFEYILLHEMKHFTFRDIFFRICLEILCIVYWWNPFVFFLKQQIINLLELRVDTTVSKNWNRSKKIDYIETLTKIYNNQLFIKTPKLIMELMGKSDTFLLKRARYLFSEHNVKRSFSIVPLVVLIIFLSTVFIFEPVSITPQDAATTFTLNNTSYILKKDNTYEFYMDGKFISEIKDPYAENFKNVPIYDNDEVN